MLTFSSEIHVKNECVRQSVYGLMNQWFNASPLAKKWLSATPCTPFDQYQPMSEYTESVDNITVEITDEEDFLLIQIKTEEDDFLRNTFCIFRDRTQPSAFYVGELLDVKKFGTVCSAENAGIYARELVQHLFWNEYQEEYDGTILNSDRTVFLTGSNIKEYLPVLTGDCEPHVNPFLYIPYGATDVIHSFERPFVGQLHILAESTPLIAGKIQELLPPDTVFPKDSVILKWHNGVLLQLTEDGDAAVSKESMIDRIQSNLQCVLVSNPPADHFSIAKLREEKLLRRFEGDPEVSAVFDSIIADKEHEIASLSQNVTALKKELHEERAKSAALQDSYHAAESEEKSAMFVMDELPKYEHETEDIILRILEKERDGMTGDKTLESSRKYHVLCDILAHNFPSETGIGLKALVKEVFGEGRLTRDGIGRLSSAGFTVEKNDRQAHYRIVWENDNRYVATYSASSSDKRAGKNTASDYNNLCFGY